jgi:ribosomal-protein-alanine N-acetyltransferase
MTDPVRLAGPRVVLREFRPDDVDGALSVVGDDEVTRWLSFDSRDRDATGRMLAAAVERAALTPRPEYYLAVTLPADDRVVGFGRLGLAGVRAAKLGYAVRASEWGNGYATETARLLTGFAFGALGLHRVSAAIGPDNDASIAVVKRLGFSYEGRLRDHVFTGGAWRDSLLYSVLAGEWPERVTTPPG